MCSVSPDSSISNKMGGEGSSALPGDLKEVLVGMSGAERSAVLCAYYQSCAARYAAGTAEGSGGSDSGSSLASEVGGFGRCYLRAICVNKRQEAYARLGPEPSFLSLLEMDRNWFLPDVILARIRVGRSTGDSCHLSDVGAYDFLQAVRILAKGKVWAYGSLATYALRFVRLPKQVISLSLLDKLGRTPSDAVGERVHVRELFSVASSVLDVRAAFPTVLQLLQMPVSWYKPRDQLLGYTVDRVDGIIRVQIGGSGTIPWLQFASWAAHDGACGEFAGGTLGHALARQPRIGEPSVDFAVDDRVASLPVDGITSADPGYCYLAVVRSDLIGTVASTLGAWPSAQSALCMPASWYDDVARSKASVDFVGCRAHVRAEGGFADFARWQARFADAIGSGQVINPQLLIGGLSLEAWLAERVGVAEATLDEEWVRLLSRSAAFHNPSAKARLKLFEALGDSALSTAIAERCIARRLTAQDYQTARSKLTSNAALAALYGKLVPPGLVLYPAGVEPASGNAGAYFLEALLGGVHAYYGSAKVSEFCENNGFFDSHSWG